MPRVLPGFDVARLWFSLVFDVTRRQCLLESSRHRSFLVRSPLSPPPSKSFNLLLSLVSLLLLHNLSCRCLFSSLSLVLWHWDFSHSLGNLSVLSYLFVFCFNLLLASFHKLFHHSHCHIVIDAWFICALLHDLLSLFPLFHCFMIYKGKVLYFYIASWFTLLRDLCCFIMQDCAGGHFTIWKRI